MGTLFRMTCLAVLVFVAGEPQRRHRRPLPATPPIELRTGDVVLQATQSSRAELIRRASRSAWSHVGLVEATPRGVFVIEAISPVSRTPLAVWAARGSGGAFTVLRARGLRAGALERVVATAKRWLGRPYDATYRWDDETLYCSELVVKAFARGAGVTLGEQQRLKDLEVTPAELDLARALGLDPEGTLVTPGSLALDVDLELVARDVTMTP
jgi:hypothetical protein